MMKAILTTFTPAEQKRTVIFPLLRHSRWFGRDKYWTKGSGLWVQEGNKWRPYTPSKIHSNGNAQWVIPEGALVLRVTLTINKSRSFTLRLYEGIAPHIDGNTYVTIQITQQSLYSA